MQDISKILHSLGLLDSEIKTYMAALKNGPGTVLELTKTTNLSRQAIYTAIQQLTDRGLMSSVQRGKKQYYAAEPPDKLLSYAKRKQEQMNEQIKDLQKAIPELELRAGGEKPVVRMYEGKEGIMSVLDHVSEADLHSMEEIGDLDAIYTILSYNELGPFRKVVKKIRNKKFLYAGEPRTPGPLPDRYFLPQKYSGFKSDVMIFPEKIVLFTFEGKVYSMVVENRQIAQAMHILFELAFKNSKHELKQK